MQNLDLAEINAQLRDKSAEEIIKWALSLERQTIQTTSFSPNAAVMLHLLVKVDRRVPVLWIDSGYNTRDTYLVAEQLTEDLQLNLQSYAPLMTTARRDAMMGIPTLDDEALHKEFTRQVKLEPFQRALEQHKPEVWLTGIRNNETAFRETLDVVSWDSRGILKVAPIFYWDDKQVDSYMAENKLPSCKRYFDPTKVEDKRECGLHTGG
ncbi:phosphoadenosine phosphosulfate reductase [Sinobacterium caligoides]|uniref:Phosphoadenosine phosphosulfate reductase n=1 Tax=Sinobacterium caligoides TaxID=933926 RepID=A0A3N2E065_9GAMM|nr:phosphoadenosine phosphosulfate reductase family protein [Sinobacterium caligoides]ROS05302.1 phosphoadenosine phosphosulfate reductase [Sinobacterium caligoides]